MDRLIFVLSLTILDVQEHPPTGGVSRRDMGFVFADGPMRPFRVELEADGGRAEVRVAVRLPVAIETCSSHDLLERLDELNALGYAAAVSRCRTSGRLQVRSNIVFSGYHDERALGVDHSFEQVEATLNLLLQVFTLAQRALHLFADTADAA